MLQQEILEHIIYSKGAPMDDISSRPLSDK